MSDINRIDQKVICIQPKIFFWVMCLGVDCPIEGQVYSVAGFADALTEPGIHLREIAGFTCACRDITNGAWPMRAFRPVDQRKTDISDLAKLLDVTPATPLTPAPIKEDA